MNLKKVISLSLIIAVFALPSLLSAHCQVPCGIYGDTLRIKLMKEHVQTIEKSMNTITKLQKKQTNKNQLVRWVNNKDEHAEKFSEIVTYYFMSQRIKPAEPENETAYKKYQDQIEILHKMLVYAMKSKQTTDLDNVEKLRELIKKFKDTYFHEH